MPERISPYLVEHNANHGGAFATSRESDAMLDAGAPGDGRFLQRRGRPEEIVFGPNMTTLTFAHQPLDRPHLEARR